MDITHFIVGTFGFQIVADAAIVWVVIRNLREMGWTFPKWGAV